MYQNYEKGEEPYIELPAPKPISQRQVGLLVITDVMSFYFTGIVEEILIIE